MKEKDVHTCGICGGDLFYLFGLVDPHPEYNKIDQQRITLEEWMMMMVAKKEEEEGNLENGVDNSRITLTAEEWVMLRRCKNCGMETEYRIPRDKGREVMSEMAFYIKTGIRPPDSLLGRVVRMFVGEEQE